MTGGLLALALLAAVAAVLLALGRAPDLPDAWPHPSSDGPPGPAPGPRRDAPHEPGGDGPPGGRGPSSPDLSEGAHPRTRAVAAAGGALAALVVLPGAWSPLGAVAVAAVVWWRSAGWEGRDVLRRRERLEADVLHVVDLLSAAVSAGASPAFALHEVAALCEEDTAAALTTWSRRLRWGSEPTDVWRDMADHEQLGRLGQVLLRSATSGAPVAAALARLAEDERDRHRGQVEARVRQIEVRAAAPLGLCLLPAFVLLGIVPLVAGAVGSLVLP